MRRVLGILTMILLFHLSLTPGDFACAAHAHHAAHGDQAREHHAGMHMAAPHHEAPDAAPTARGQGKEHCPTPTTPACCVATASCGAVYVAHVATDALGLVSAASEPHTIAMIATSRATGPETPPPRA